MDFPLFHLDFIGNRMLIALTAIIHVVVNHPMAVGAIPLATLLEWRAWKKGIAGLDEVAYKITFVFFVITTSLGALTGVGIWFTTSLVNPAAIGSLLRVFFWGWFTEWIVFVVEVSLILWYFLSWKKYTGERKKTHIRLGVVLSLFSWLTMMIITGILGFMMDPGQWEPYFKLWTPESNMLTAFFNPLYWPQLAFRTPFALMTAGLFFMFLVPFFTKHNKALRGQVIRVLSIWTLAFLPLTVAAGLWYWQRIPGFMVSNAPVAITTQDYTQWYNTILVLLVAMTILIALIALLGTIIPRRLPRLSLFLPFIAAIALLGYFERVREFVRKPYVIKDYMYANGYRVQDYPLFKEDGILPHAAFVENKEVTEENKLAAGHDVFLLACSRCHTMSGINSINKRFSVLFPNREWQPEQVTAFMENMHNVRPFMPPFPGNQTELEALALYIVENQNRGFRVEGAQSVGMTPRTIKESIEKSSN